MCKMSRERVSGVGGEKLRGMVFGDIVIVPFAVYILFPAVKIFEDLEDKGYVLKKK